MKANRYFIALIISIAWNVSIAQRDKIWDYGLSANVGLEHFKVTTTLNLVRDQNNINSDFAISAGFWAERHLGRRFSIITSLNCSAVRVGYNVFTGGVSKYSYGDMVENHSYVSISEKGRLFFAEKGNRKLFFDLGVKIDRMISFKNSDVKGGGRVWNPKGYSQLNPGLLAGFGISKGRWRLFAEYQYFLGTSLSKAYRENLQNSGVKWDVNRQNFSLGVAFLLNRSR